MRLRALWIALCCLALALPVLAPMNRMAFDAGTRILRSGHPAGGGEVVLVGLDEDTEKAFPEPLALWHRHLGAVFEGLALGGPRAVGVDINMPSRSFDALAPGSDAALLRGILRLKQACPLVLGVTVEATGQPRPFHAPFQAAAGPEGQGFITWVVDPDHVVRTFTERPKGRSQAIPTLAGQMARRLGRPVHEGRLDYQGAGPVPYVPMHLVAQWALEGNREALARAFQGKAVLVGSVLPFVDRHHQIVDLNGWGEDNQGYAPGVLLHVQAVRNLLGRGFIRPVPSPVPLLLALALASIGWLLARRPAPGGLLLAATVLLLALLDLALLRRGFDLGPALPFLALLAGFASRALAEAWGKLRERRRLRAVFGGYVSPAILKEILAGRLDPSMEGEMADLCVLFSDVRGFTTLSEGLRPREVITLMNRYFDRMAPAIHAEGGTIVSYMGDGIMAHFGHPAALTSPSRTAFQASRAMLEALEILNRELVAEGLPALRIGIGLHAGEAIVGHIGSRERHEYTAIGDTVNVASRIEGLTKEAGYPLLLTEPVLAHLGGEEGIVPLGERAIKGHTALKVFGWKPPSPAPQPGGTHP